MKNKNDYYFVGAKIDDVDKTDSFLSSGKWELGWFEQENDKQYKKMSSVYNDIKPGDFLIIKSTYTRKKRLPFPIPADESVSVMKIKAIGEVLENLQDGHTLSVNWNKDFQPKEWYFYTERQTIWKVPSDSNVVAKKLIDFVIDNIPQDYDWFINQPNWKKYKQAGESLHALTEEDYTRFKDYLDGFLSVVNSSKGNIGKDKNGKDIRNFVENGTMEGIKLPSGLPLGKRYAATGNKLYRYPYVNNQNWTNLYYDWEPKYFSEPTLFVTVPNQKAEDFKYSFEKPFSVTTGAKQNTVYGFQAKSTLKEIDYKLLLNAMYEITNGLSKEGKSIENEAGNQMKLEYKSEYSQNLIDSKNIIFRGAPGTGKSYLAKEVAADIVSGGEISQYSHLTKEQKSQIEFVQFHPSYDYTDFVEGLRPKANIDGTMSFQLEPGIFSKFVAKARKNYEDAHKTEEEITKEKSAQKLLDDFFNNIDLETNEFQTLRGNNFSVIEIEDDKINISIPNNPIVKFLTLNLGELQKMLESGKEFQKVKDLNNFFEKANATQHFSYYLTLFKEIKKTQFKFEIIESKVEKEKPFIFIIDEINRGEISKIFGELFFSIDPGYRGEEGTVATQYSNLHKDADFKFYVPKNIYIIGTMNDIDRSVDSFDFAMRRRFRFINIKAEDRVGMLDELVDRNEALYRMTSLNKAISSVDELNENYHIGASYFLKLKDISFEKLWDDYLAPLLQDYVRGLYNEEELIELFRKSYYSMSGDADESVTD